MVTTVAKKHSARRPFDGQVCRLLSNPIHLASAIVARWAWSEKSETPLAQGDATLVPLFVDTQPEVDGYAIAVDRGILFVEGLNVDRRGRLRASTMRAAFDWPDVAEHEIRDGIALVQIRPSSGGWLLAIRGNAETWPAVLTARRSSGPN